MQFAQDLRRKIDRLDDKLLDILEQRMQYVREIGIAKRRHNSPIYDPKREKEILTRLINKSKTLEPKVIESLFSEIFAISRNIEKPERVAFLGPVGSYTHQAAQKKFRGFVEYLSLHTIYSVFSAVAQGRARYGVVPLENNQNGAVAESIDCLVESNLKIISEVTLAIHHCLATKCQDLSEIQVIYSKDVALGQCEVFLRSYELENIKFVPVDSTAKAAQLASTEANCAAICSSVAARLYHVPILFENIEDSNKNKTRFVIIGDFVNLPGNQDKTSLFLSLKNSQKPGALLEVLQDFKDYGINLTKIDSRPIKNREDFSFGFYIDFLGHRDDENVRAIFNKRADELKWLGSYPSEDFIKN